VLKARKGMEISSSSKLAEERGVTKDTEITEKY
jgi:hypothetical protein